MLLWALFVLDSCNCSFLCWLLGSDGLGSTRFFDSYQYMMSYVELIHKIYWRCSLFCLLVGFIWHELSSLWTLLAWTLCTIVWSLLVKLTYCSFTKCAIFSCYNQWLWIMSYLYKKQSSLRINSLPPGLLLAIVKNRSYCFCQLKKIA